MRLQKKIEHNVDFISAKGSSRLNEDAFSINKKDHVFAVFDGATSLTPFTDSSGRTGAYRASNIAKEVFDMGGADLNSLVLKTNAKMRAEMLEEGIDIGDKLNLWGTTAAAVKIYNDRFNWLQISDTNIIVIYKDGSSKFLVENNGHDSKTLARLKSFIDGGSKNPTGEIMPYLIEQRRRLNVAYGVIAGEESVNFIKTGSESLEGVKALLIFSDGMMIPQSTPGAPANAGQIASEYEKNGLKGWLATVRSMEDSDPDLQKYIRFKQHDDATAIAITFK